MSLLQVLQSSGKPLALAPFHPKQSRVQLESVGPFPNLLRRWLQHIMSLNANFHGPLSTVCSPCSHDVNAARVSSPRDRSVSMGWHVQHKFSSISSSKRRFFHLRQTIRNRNIDQTIVDQFPAEMTVVGTRVRVPKCFVHPSRRVDMCSNEIGIIVAFGLGILI